MKIALIDLKESAKGCNNKDVAGTFGNASHGEGVMAKFYALFKRKNVVLPVGHMGYLSAILRKQGHQVSFYDATPKDEEVVIISSSLVGFDEELDFVRKIRRPNRKIGFINAFSSVKPEIFLEEADFVIKGEPEAAVAEFGKGNLELKGIVDSPLVQDIETLPFPDWDGFPVNQFSYYPILKKKPLLPILTSRGCSFNCSYCPYMVVQTEKFRSRSPKHAVDEIEFMQKKYGVRSFVFRDIIFSQNKKRAVDIAEEILKRGIKIEWTCETRSDCLNEEMIQIFYRAGMRGLHLGIESPREDIQKGSGRIAIKESQQEKIVRACQKLGVKVMGFFILGFMDDTRETMMQTIDYAKHLNTALAQFDVMTPYPGTRFFDEIQDKIQSFDWKKYTTHHPVVKLEHSTHAEVLELKNRAYREYYFRPTWMLTNGFNLLFK